MALTIGAAAVTLVVIIGVLSGPTIVNCFNSPDGMGLCLRGEMRNAGILPQPAASPAEAATPAAAPTTATTVEPDTAIAEPKTDVTQPATPVPDGLVAATFGLLRAEPDGSVVIAGSGTPGSEVEVFADEALLGTATVEPSGDWVLVPDAPLPAGGLELTLGEAGKPGRAADSFVVAINADKSSEPLVVASTPGAASAILQGIDTTQQASQLASAEPAQTTPASSAVPSVATPTPQTATVAPAAPAVSQSSSVAAPASAPETQLTPEPEPTPATPDTAVATAPANDAPDAVLATAAPVSDGTPPVTPTLSSTPPTIDAIEIEGETTFFAGAGPDGADIRLYVDDVFVADAKVSDGRWLVEGGPVLKQPNQRVRIDLLQPGSADVASRAEVNFAVQLPAAVADATITPPTAPTDAAAPAPKPTTAPATVAATGSSDTAPAPTSSALANESNAAVANAAPTPATAPAPAETAVLETPAPATAPVADALANATPAPTPPEPTAADATPESSIPTMTAVAIGDPEAARFASGKAIIRRGDNLWTIAKRVYGEGIRYTTIYEANTGQIRDPDRIYPGQVFGLPQGTAN